MRILIISRDGDILDLAIRLKQEGNDVKIAIQEKDFTRVGSGFGIKKAKDWQKELSWVGKDGLIIFDQTGFGKVQDELRKQGYLVVGGSEGGDRLEFDRYHAQEIFKKCGMKTVPSKHFLSADDAIEFVKKNKGQWVVKQNGHADKCFSYSGKMPDGSDVIDLLNNYKKYNRRECSSIDLQQRVDGIELGVARYFNGQDWVGHIEMNIEHKKLFPGGLGPKTAEMGTLIWYDDNENNRIFCETLAKLKPYLQKINFKGDIDINCIVNEDGAVPLEATPRFGYPAIHVQSVLNLSSWGGFLKAVAEGKEHDLKWRKGFGIVVLIAVPPFPYQAVNNKYNPEGLRIHFTKELIEDDWRHIHFSEVYRMPSSNDCLIAAKSGYVMCVTGVGKTIHKAREGAYSLIDKIAIPKMFFRNDIGLKFIEREKELLEKWGWI
ncbi:MAG: phosphoribosylglycinamide synthetase C domain-containing protein [Nitrospirota bacterium]